MIWPIKTLITFKYEILRNKISQNSNFTEKAFYNSENFTSTTISNFTLQSSSQK